MKRAALVFLSTAVLSGGVFSAARADALTIRTLNSDGCQMGTGSVSGMMFCGLTLGSDMPPSTMTGVYADVQTYSVKPVLVNATRFSYTGGGASGDYWQGNPNRNSNGFSDVYLPLINFPTGATVYDYGEVQVSGGDIYLGIAYLSSK